MSEILKKPYKITLWEDRNKIIYNNNSVQNQYLEEICIATIGSDTMDTPIRAFNPILTEELNGSKTFTFQIYSRYWDDEEEEFKLNPFTNLLVNERRVKLKYDGNWYEFVIKQVQENSESYTFTYTCKDLFVNELGKTGYEVELNTELYNNMGTVTELASTILEGTDWSVDESNCDTLIQRNKEMLYSYSLPLPINVANMVEGGTITISANQVILVFQSCKLNKESRVQLLYKQQGNNTSLDEAIANFYKVDEYGFITNAKNYSCSLSTLPEHFYDDLSLTPYFGEKILNKQEIVYLPQIGETCTVWEKEEDDYYCYTELEYASVAEVQDMLSNSSGFISTNGWIPEGSGNSVTLDTYKVGDTVYRAIRLNGTVYNTGFYDNRALLSPRGFIEGEQYVVMVRGSNTLGTGSYLKLIPSSSGTSKEILQDSGIGSTSIDGYTVRKLTCTETISYAQLLSEYGDLRFYLDYSGKLVDCKVFKYRVDSSNNMIIPDLQTASDSIIKTRYNFFSKSQLNSLGAIYTKEDLKLDSSQYNTHGYTAKMIPNYQKVTSITGSKSNRFNLIQQLCEAFECWVKFDIQHDDMGRIAYSYLPITSNEEFVEGGRYYTRSSGSGASSNDELFTIYTGESFEEGTLLYKKVYSKKVSFKKYIGDDNLTGFRYGINLKSIQRNVISDQIASKVIVQPNTNEFAPNGSCTIQQSVLNPTGENALYNFQYFINHNLLDSSALFDDLYGTNGGLGFFSNMKTLNDEIQPKISELSEISKTLYTLNSRQAVYDALLKEAQDLYNDVLNEINASGYSSTSGSVPEYIENLRTQKDSYSSTIDYYSGLSTHNKNLLNAYIQKYNSIETDLKEVRLKKDQLNNDFENKYFRFIQEGTWTSANYWDPELYYQAANMVLYTSSFPQVSYTINVIEISQVEGFESYKFAIGDKTYIEDTEFFGYDRKGRPYKEEIVISQVKINLDDPSQNTITVRNYKTQFQDLFQRMAATSQSLQYHEGEYNRAASAINDDGTINSALMQNTLEANALVISNANNQSVTWDETGITISNFVNANEIVRLTSGGIVLSTDGGRNWTTGITGNGINANVITAGRIDTDRIRIFNKAMQQTFEWNSTGINAYMWDSTIGSGSGAVNYGKFVRFDQYGLYGYAGGNPSWDPNTSDNGTIGINKVIRDSIFSLTWKGLNIKTGAQGGFSQIVNPEGNPSAQMWYELSSNQYILTDDIEVEAGKTYYKSDNEVINVNDKFKVDGQGNITLAGSITLAGNITWGNNAPDSVTSQAVYDAIYNGVGNDQPFQGLFYVKDNDNGLYISASAIKTGTLSAEYINGGTLSGVSLNINNNFQVDSTGVLSCTGATVTGTVKADSLLVKRNGTYTSILTGNSNSTTRYIDMQYASGNFGGTFSGTIESPSLTINNSNGQKVGSITTGNAVTASYALNLESEFACRILAKNGSLYLCTKDIGEDGYYLQISADGILSTNCTLSQYFPSNATAVFG